ncbi:TonB-dependent Receptor Plug Domain [Pedobacter suwonensis]|uniref:TonB-dependent Receptor Plug Domain n=1 Tax=Pedobacter suwonensis TaxID=332999 RepID=A0A1I0TVM5_9SPHI|nr:TonB-dependent receptor [Pedobacter suwonensis]SFA55874.1 TonB-dependent Receptor Plug Domain [Pedobacter suwonensis]
MKQIYTSLVLFFICSSVMAQVRNMVIGTVVDPQNKPLELVNVKILETNQYAITDKNGLFRINGSETNNILTLEFSYIGYQKLSLPVTVKAGETNLGNIRLEVLDLSLENIEINAKRNYSGSTNSSLIITRDLIEQTPALSVNDLLNQIPNRKIQPPSLQNVQNINLRAAYAPTTDGKGAFELNNAFGIAIVMDGNTISNNANMQSFNAGRTGGVGSAFVKSGSYGIRGTGNDKTGYTGDYTFGGTDLRQIPADNIESIEVIPGVAPAKYGDLTDGAIIIERQAGKSPAYVRMQLRDNATSYSFSKGFEISPRYGAVNVGINYVNSFEDNRDKLKAYRRINTNAMWTNSFSNTRQLKNTFSIDYGRNLDGIKFDPDDEKSTRTKFDSWNFSVANRSNYRFNNGFLKNIGLNLRYAEGHQVSYKEELVNDAYVLYSTATTTGIHEGYYDSGIYTAKSLIDGRPINAAANLDFTGGFATGSLVHNLSFGTSFSYSANKGLGQTIDPNEPRGTTRVANTSLGTKSSERYYDFRLALAQKDLGFYIEDLFTATLLGKPLNVRAGMRTDIQNGYTSFSPRTNINYEVNKNLRFGVAYGLSYKSPGLAQRFPGPTFFEIPLLNAYNGKVNESTYLVYVERYEPTSVGLKPSKSESIELSAQLKINKFSLSLTAFNKKSRDGISTVQNLQSIFLPSYTATLNAGAKPTINQTGTKAYAINYSTFKNDLLSDNQGFEAILNTPEISEIKTSFNISGGLFKTKSRSVHNLLSSEIPNTITTDPNYAYIGVYEPKNTRAYFSNGRITSLTHVPKLSLVVSFIAEFQLLDKVINTESSRIPLGYYTSTNQYIAITNFDRNNSSYGHLYKTPEQQAEANLPRIFSNYHMSIAKEIKKRFKFAFNVYNVFNYQPYYVTPAGTYNYPNSSPTFGAELSIKL